MQPTPRTRLLAYACGLRLGLDAAHECLAWVDPGRRAKPAPIVDMLAAELAWVEAEIAAVDAQARRSKKGAA